MNSVLPGLWLRLPNSVTSPLFSNFYIGFKIYERIEYKHLSLTHKALTITQLLLHSLISDQPPRVRATRSVVTLSRPHTHSSLRITNRSFRYICITSSLESISCLIPPALYKTPSWWCHTYKFTSHLLNTLTLHHTFTVLFIPGSKLTFSTNRFHHSLLAPTWTAFSAYTRPDLLGSTVFHFCLLFIYFLILVVR